MNGYSIFLLMVSLSDATVAVSQSDLFPAEINFGDPIETVNQAIVPHCQQLDFRILEAPLLPVSAEHEVHLVCTGLDAFEDEDNRLIFYFADRALAMIEIHAAAIESRFDLDMQYFDFRVRSDEHRTVLVDELQDIAWIVPTTNMHSSPFLASTVFTADQTDIATAQLPEGLELGASTAQIQQAIVPACQQHTKRTIEPSNLPITLDEQVQIDCLGFSYAGLPRKLELVFADDQLVLVWILTGKAEEQRVRQRLIEIYGAPVRVTEMFESFADESILLRKDKPEVALATPELSTRMLNSSPDD